MPRLIPPAVVRRLPRYYRFVDELCRKGISRISSGELGESLGLTASQVRQDFSCLGGFGQQGYGYNTRSLRDNLSDVLHLREGYRGILVGTGNLGLALLNNFSFESYGLKMLAAFDVDPKKIGTLQGGVRILDAAEMEDFCEREAVNIVVLTCPGKSAQAITDRLLARGIRGIWNFTNEDLYLTEPSAALENVHFSDSLMTLTCRIPLSDE